MALEIELKFFEAHRSEWVKTHDGKYALIKDEQCEGFFDTREAAYERGVRTWGNTPFLAKQVLSEDVIGQMPALVHGLIDAHL